MGGIAAPHPRSIILAQKKMDKPEAVEKQRLTVTLRGGFGELDRTSGWGDDSSPVLPVLVRPADPWSRPWYGRAGAVCDLVERETSMRFDIPGRTAVAFLAMALILLLPCCSSSGNSGHDDQMSGADGGSTPTDPGPQAPSFSSTPMVNSTPMVSSTSAPATSMQEEPTLSEVAARAKVLQERQEELSKHYLSLGDRYLAQGLAKEALGAYSQAVTAMPTNEEAQGKYSRLAAALGVSPESTGGSVDSWRAALARGQQATALANDYFARGRTLTGTGEYAAAIAAFRNAQAILETNPSIDAAFDRNAVQSALEEAIRMKERAELDASARRRMEVEDINRRKDEEERNRVTRRADELWKQALNLFERERFEDCERVCADLRELAPDHPHVGKLQQAAVLARHQKRNADNIRMYREQWQNALNEVKDIGMPEPDLITFPSKREWDRIAARGPITLSKESEAVNETDQEIARRLEGTMLSNVDWTDKTLDEAIRFIRNSTGVNITILRIVDEAKPAEDRVLSLSLLPMSAMSALRHAVNYLELAMVIEDGMVKVTTKEGARSTKVMDFYPVKDLTADLNSFPGVELNLNPSGFGAGRGGLDEPEVPDPTRTIESDRLMELIRQTIDPTSWDEDPANTISYNSGQLVITQTPKNHHAIRQLLADLRNGSGMQVHIEARFISVENNFLQDIGVDFRGLGDNSGGIGVPGAGTSRPFDDFGAPGVNNVLGTDNSSGAYYNFGGGNGDVRGRTQNLYDIGLGNPDVLTAAGGFSLQWTYLDDTQLEAILRATQKYERVNTVTAPSLMVSNTQRSNLQLTTQVAYIKDFDVELAQAATIADPVVEVVREGVVMDVRPIVSNDRRFITLELRPSVATLVRPIRTFSTTLGTGSPVTFETPELRKESLKTTVVMPDGGTLLLGGLKFYEEQDMESGVPILKDIPILEFFFSRKGKYTAMRDLIVLLRAKVVIPSEFEPGRR